MKKTKQNKTTPPPPPPPKKTKQQQQKKHAPLQGSVRGYIRENSIAMFLQIQTDIYLYQKTTRLRVSLFFLFFKGSLTLIRKQRENSPIKPSHISLFPRRDKNSTDIKQK